MKYIALLCGAVALSACTESARVNTRSADLPGVPTTINCNPEPVRVFSKTGDLIEVSYPVLHPSCRAKAASVARSAQNVAPSEKGFWTRVGDLFLTDPNRDGPRPKLEADGDDPVIVSAVNPAPLTPKPDTGTQTGGTTGGSNSPAATTNPGNTTGQGSGTGGGSTPNNGSNTGSGAMDPGTTPTTGTGTDTGSNTGTDTGSNTGTDTGTDTETGTEPSDGLSKLDLLKQHAGVL